MVAVTGRGIVKTKAAVLFFLTGFFFLTLFGCASQSGQNKWLPVSNTNTLRNAAELGLNSLDDIKARVDQAVREKASPERLKELFEFNNKDNKDNKESLELNNSAHNLARWSETDTRNHFFPHSGIRITGTAKGIQECMRANKTYHAHVLDITAYTEKEVGNFLKNKLNFEVIRIKNSTYF